MTTTHTSSRPTPSDRALWSALVGLGALAAAITQRATSHGVPTFGDSGAYFGMAENLRHGRGLTLPFDLAFDRFSPLQVFRFHGAVPSTHFPPGYPLALTLFSPPGVAVTTGARILGCVLAAATVILSGRLTMRLLPHSRRWFQLATPALLIGVAGQPVGFLLLHAQLGSEALFIVAVQAGLLCGFRYLEAPSRRRLILLTATTAVAVLTRNVGLFLPTVLVPAILLTQSQRLASRVKAGAVLAIGAVSPWAAFVVYGRLLAGSSGGSALGGLVYHPLGSAVHDLTRVIGSWILAPDATGIAHAVALLTLTAFAAAATVSAMRRSHSATSRRDTFLAAAAIPLYIAFVLYAQAFVDAGIPINDRLLSPVRPIFTAVAVAGFAAVTARLRPSIAGALLALLAVAIVAPRLSEQRHLIDVDNRAKPPYSDLARLRATPKSTLIVSPEADVVTLAIQHPAITTARPLIAITDRPNRCFRRDLAENAALLDYYGGYVYFTVGPFEYPDAATTEQLGRLVRLHPVSSSRTGSLYRVTAVRGAPPPTALPC